ncbi:MAG: TetR/AcrR family transcriptional regulator [Candidatus Helarchaeota archaeon]
MNDYLLTRMRIRDQNKYNNIVKVTIKLVNELGFNGISISKIAKKANVSPATIYIYFENKEDLFTKLYIKIRNEMSQGALQNLQTSMSKEEEFHSIWYGSFMFNRAHPEYLTYCEQFEHTTMMKNIDLNKFELYRYVRNFLQRGIEENIIKDLPLPLLTSFAFIPIIPLLKFHFEGTLIMNENLIKQACEIAWNAIKKI